jgi:hypothetical protein
MLLQIFFVKLRGLQLAIARATHPANIARNTFSAQLAVSMEFISS